MTLIRPNQRIINLGGSMRFKYPGGAVAAAWTPASPTTDGGVSPHTWFYAGQSQMWTDSGKTDLVDTDGDSVGALTNQGSDSFDIIQATSSAKPTWKTGILNSQPVFRFDGGDFLAGAFAGGAISQPYTIFSVFVADFTGAVDRIPFSGDDSTNFIFGAPYHRASPIQWAMYAGSIISNGAEDMNWHIWTALFNSTTSALWDNGVSAASGNAGTKVLDGFTLGARYGGANYWVGDLADILIYTSNLSDADKIQIQGYLATRYNQSVGDYST